MENLVMDRSDIVNPVAMLVHGEVSYVEHVMDEVSDRKEGEPQWSEWYVVHIETPDQTHIQTMSFVVSLESLGTVLASMGWTVEPNHFRQTRQYANGLTERC
jgi:hypothetical protein